MTILFVVIGAICIVVAAVAPLVPPLPRWPKPNPREHECLECRVSYTRAWQLDQHNSFHHPRPDLEDARVEDRS